MLSMGMAPVLFPEMMNLLLILLALLLENINKNKALELIYTYYI
jgi:hypothetical protein